MALDYRRLAWDTAKARGVDPQLFLRLVKQESGFNPGARSDKGAFGLTQAMPATARDPGFGVEPIANPRNPQEQLRFGADYLSAMLDRYDGDVKRALVAYNWGPGNADKWSGRMSDLPAETRGYVAKIAQAEIEPSERHYNRARELLSSESKPRDNDEIPQKYLDRAREILGKEPVPQDGGEAEPGFLRGIYEGGKRAIVGDAEYPDAPEITQWIKHVPPERREEFAELGRLLFLADSEPAMADIVKKQMPDAEVFADKNSNLYVRFPGVEPFFALDKSGLSPRDADELLKLGLMAVGGMAGAKAGGAVAGTAGRILGAGAGAAAETDVEQRLSKWAGSEQDYDFGRTTLAAAFGVGGETAAKILEATGAGIWRLIRRAKTGTRGPQELRLKLEAEGLDPDLVNDQVAQALRRAGVEDFEGDALERIAKAESLPTPVRLTTGQAKRDPYLMGQEAIAARTDVYGDEVRRAAMDKMREQQTGLFESARQMVEERAPGNVAETGRRVQDTLSAGRQQAWRGVGDAYSAARDAPGQAVVGIGAVDDFARRMRTQLQTKYFPNDVPRANEALSDLAKRLAPRKTPAGTVRPKGLEIRQLENWRTRVSSAANSAQGSDRAALNEILRAYDESALGSLKRAVIAGDQETIDLWRKAVASRKNFGRKWERGDILDKMTRSKRGEVVVDEEDVVATLIGKSTLGAGKNVARETARLKDYLLKNDPEAWGRVQGEAVVKLLGLDPRNMDEVPEVFSTKIVGRLQNLREQHPNLYATLFDPKERTALKAFADTVAAVNTNPARSAMNPSGTGFINLQGFERLNRIVGWLGNQFGPGGSVVATMLMRQIDNAEAVARDQMMARSLRGVALGPRRSLLPSGAGAAPAPAIAQSFGDDRQQ